MKIYSRIIVFIVLIFSTASVIAQAPPPPGDGEVEDVLPINLLIYPFLVLGAYLGYRFRDKFLK